MLKKKKKKVSKVSKEREEKSVIFAESHNVDSNSAGSGWAAARGAEQQRGEFFRAATSSLSLKRLDGSEAGISKTGENKTARRKTQRSRRQIQMKQLRGKRWDGRRQTNPAWLHLDGPGSRAEAAHMDDKGLSVE